MSHSQKVRKYLTEEEFQRLIAAIRKHKSVRDEAIFTVAYWRGLRISEIGMIPFSAWNRAEHRIYITRLKGSLDGEYPLSPAEHQALIRWAVIRGNASGPLFTSQKSRKGALGMRRRQLDRLMHKYATEAMIPADLRHVHALKHSIGTHLIAKGAELFAVKDWLGHSSINSTLIYAQFRNAQRDSAAQKIYTQR